MNLEELVEEFALHIAAQNDAIFRADSRTGNRHYKRAMAAVDKLRAQGKAGWDALAVLLAHARMDVRVSAAALLLRHRTEEARVILEEAAAGQGLAAMEAFYVLKHWAEGSWDPEKLGEATPAAPNPRKKRPKPA